MVIRLVWLTTDCDGAEQSTPSHYISLWLQSIYIQPMNDSPHLHHQIYISSSQLTEEKTLHYITVLIIELEYINLHDNIKTFSQTFFISGRGISIDQETSYRVTSLWSN